MTQPALTPLQRLFSRKLIFWCLMAGALAADLVTKAWASAVIKPTDPMVTPVIPGVLGWKWAINHGAAFSMFEGRDWFLVIVGIGILGAIFFYMYTTPPARRWFLAALALISAGAVGNLYDRINLGHVRDFIYFDFDLPFAGHGIGWLAVPQRWPVFNVADMAILAGVGILFVMSFRKQPKAPDPAAPTAEAAAPAEPEQALPELEHPAEAEPQEAR